MNKRIIYSTFLLGMFLMIGSIAEGGFNISEWSQEGRAFTSFLILFGMILVFSYPFKDESDYDKW